MWKLVVPLLPLLFLVAPGVWRNICPLAASNQTPRVLGLTRGLTTPTWLKEYGYVVAISLFVLFVVLRKLGLDDSGPASAFLLLGALTGGFLGGMYLKGQSGWCSSICPLLPVQRIYGQTPFALVGNSHCQPCVGCTTNCYDFNPKAAYLADLHAEDPCWSGYRRFFVAAFPGLVLAFFEMPEAPDAIGVPEMLGRVALYMAVSVASFQLLSSFVKVSAHKLTTLYGALGFNLFYWYGGPALVESLTGEPSPDAVTWALHAAVFALTAAWVLRTYQKEAQFHAEAAARAGGLSAAAGRSLVRSRSLKYQQRHIETRLNTRAVRIDRGARTVELGTGEQLPYDRLILALGSSAAVPRIDGFGGRGTFVLRSAEDALSIRAFAQREWCREALIAGGGLLGLEAGYALHKLGLHASILERSDRLLRRQLDARASEFLRRYLEGLGMSIVTGAETAAALGDERLSEVLLRDGRALPADMLLVCAGITPNTQLAAEAELEVGRGVLVDDLMTTSDHAIFAAGDVAEHRGRVHGLWPAAVEQAEVAACGALGEDKAYVGTVPVTILKVVGIELTSIGRFEPEGPHEEVIALEEESEGRYRKLVIADGRIVGAILLGYSAEASPVVTAVKRSYDVSALLPELRAGRWDALGGLSGEHAMVPAAPANPSSG
jgi:NADPH-dependent 2,4-dienoyl-CoA reductase/sulfur reductase-like enzyme